MKALIHVNSHPLLNIHTEKTITRRRKISALAPKTNLPFIAILNGKPIMRVGWSRRLQDGDSLYFYIVPQGGGGGKSNPLAAVLTIAAIFVLPGIGGMIGAELGISTAAIGGIEGFSAMALFKGAVTFSGMSLLSAMMPTPKAPTSQAAASLAAPSPTYSLSAQGNSARIEAPIPVQYGRMRTFPDFAAIPYTEFAGNEQFLYELFCIGCGAYSVESIKIEDTDITSFDDVTTEIVNPGGTLTLFPADVASSVEVSGQEALTNVYLGPFTVNASGTVINAIAIDVIFPRGLYAVNGEGSLVEQSVVWAVEARTINDIGTVFGSYATLGTEIFTGATTTPQRMSYRYTVSNARYQVRIKRTDTKNTASNFAHEMDWIGLRGYLPETRDYGNVTLLAVRMRASGNISGMGARRINVIATRKVQTWSPGGGWATATANSSIAWAFADAAMDSVYGGGLPAARVDLQALYDLDAVWTARGDYFNGRFDGVSTVMDALSKIVAVGRARVYMQGGIHRVFRDGAATVPTVLFSMRNIVKGSFGIEYIMPSDESANHCDVGYWDADVWAARRVLATPPGVTPGIAGKFETFGITNRDHAGREGAYRAAASLYRRKIITFTAEMSGYLPSLGNLIAIQHDLPEWGQHGEITAWNAGTLTATLSDPPVWTDGATHYIGLRKRDGSLSGPWVVTKVDDYRILFATTPDITPYTGLEEARTHISFGPGDLWRQRARVISVKPQSLYTVKIEAVNEDARVHAADTGLVVAGSPVSNLARVLTAPVVTGLTAMESIGNPLLVQLSWNPAPGAEYYLVEQSLNGGMWTRLAEPRGTMISVLTVFGDSTSLRVAAVGSTRGPWAEITREGWDDRFWTGDDDPYMTNDENPYWGPIR
ncbi:MAG: phage tail protein [Magnetococcales bacterium]|nr:phage tail protein [Magnetococcales bacterium]MBF0438299.1 phage tail protein [Magnetococcales bacterium]